MSCSKLSFEIRTSSNSFLEYRGNLGIRKMIIPRHGNLKSVACRLKLLFEKEYYRRIFIARLIDAHIVDHVIAIELRLWASLIFDSSDSYPIMP